MMNLWSSLRLSFSIAATIFLWSSWSGSVSAFTAHTRPITTTTTSATTAKTNLQTRVTFVVTNNGNNNDVWRLQMSDDGEKEESEAPAEEEEEVTEAKAEVVEEDGEEEKEEEEPNEEDPALTALKEEIAALEIELKTKRIKASNTQDLADDYTEKGYRRKCAEMDNMRRMRSQASSSDKMSSRARIVSNFIPILDSLKALEASYADNEFAQKYKALPRDFENCLIGLDVTEFTVEAGTVWNPLRCTAVKEEYSDDAAKGVILRVESSGYEVQGNVVRPAGVVLSLGKEEEEKPEEDSSSEEEEKVVEEK